MPGPGIVITSMKLVPVFNRKKKKNLHVAAYYSDGLKTSHGVSTVSCDTVVTVVITIEANI